MKRKSLQSLLLSAIMVSLSTHCVPLALGHGETIETVVAAQEKSTKLIVNKKETSKKIETKTGWTTCNLNVRESSSTDSEILGVLPFNTCIKYEVHDEDWAKITYKSKESYVNLNYISKKENKNTTYSIPSNKGFKSYMSYKAITSKSSMQYKLQENAYTGTYGIRQVSSRYCIALGTHFDAKIGQYIDLILENGTVIHCILGDVKADIHTESNNIFTSANKCCSEFICSTSDLDKEVKKRGDISFCCNEWNSLVEKVKVYDKNYFDD